MTAPEANGGKGQTPDPNVVELVIRYNQATGMVGVEGPLNMSMLCYGMLESAKEVIFAQQFKKNEARRSGGIVSPQGFKLPGLKT